MAGQGLPTSTEVTQEAGFEQYVDIGKGSGDPDDYIRIWIKPRNSTDTALNFKDHDGDGLIDNVDGAPGTGETPLYVQIRFVKRRQNELKVSHFYETKDALYDTLVLQIKFDGGTSGTNYSSLKTSIQNYSANEIAEVGLNFKFECTTFGDNTSLLPYRDVDNGEKMFANDFKIKTHEVFEESTTTVDDSFYSIDQEDNGNITTTPSFYSVEDPDGVSSTFADLQKDICIKEDVVDEFASPNPDLKRICPKMSCYRSE